MIWQYHSIQGDLSENAHPGMLIQTYIKAPVCVAHCGRSKEYAKMKTLILLALFGFVLAVGLTLPLSEDKSEVKNPELKEIASNFQAEDKEK